MTDVEFAQAFEALCHRIEAAPTGLQYLFQPDLHALVERALRAGVKLPDAVRALDEQLTDAVIEAQFDNMPV